VIPLRGFLVPGVVGAGFAPHYTDVANVRGWPVRLGKWSGRVTLAQAIGTTINLGSSNALWLGLRAPRLHHAYAVEGVQVHYVLRGVSHTMTISQSTAPDVICSSSSNNTLRAPAWCSRDTQDANWVATVLTVERDTTGRIADEVKSVTELSINELTGREGQGVPSLAAVRQLSTRLFPADRTDGILSVTGVLAGTVPEWRFVIRDSSRHTDIVRCTNRGLVTRIGSTDSISGVGVVACPSPT
jgi:hypothetical protein